MTIHTPLVDHNAWMASADEINSKVLGLGAEILNTKQRAPKNDWPDRGDKKVTTITPCGGIYKRTNTSSPLQAQCKEARVRYLFHHSLHCTTGIRPLE